MISANLIDCPSRQGVLPTEDRHLEAQHVQSIARVLLPLLALLLLASSASAQDIPALVLIDIDLHWMVPFYGGPVSLSGVQE